MARKGEPHDEAGEMAWPVRAMSLLRATADMLGTAEKRDYQVISLNGKRKNRLICQVVAADEMRRRDLR